MASDTPPSRDASSARQVRQRILRWLNRTVTKSGSDRKAPPPPPPLPSPRPRPITPSDSLPCLPQDQSPFFSRLPPEIRRVILLYAFGNCTVHMDLALDHPMLERAKLSSSGRVAHGELTRQRDISAPRQWLWRSSVCHRNPPWTPPQHLWWRLNWHRPDVDRCMEGDGFACRTWLGEWPVKCRVGALGWLLSCRQAYDEGIDLLYMTNTFHLSGEQLLTRLPDYILSARLAQISSFEIVIPLSGSMEHSPFQPASETLSPTLNMLAQNSGIRRLHLCLPCPQLRGRVVNVNLSHVLDAVDAFVRTSHAESTVLQMDPAALMGVAARACVLEEDSAEPTQSGYTYQMWRCLDGDASQVRIVKRTCFFPQVLAPLRDPASSELGASWGYWIMEFLEKINFIGST